MDEHSFFLFLSDASKLFIRCPCQFFCLFFVANDRESGVMLLAELLDYERDFRVISLTARQIVAVPLLSVIILLK